MIYSDRNLSQKLERTEARSNAAFVEARARLMPESGAEWIEVAGALPGSGSQRNAEKNGFSIAYTRTKWQLKI
jgi:hypothetical protein